jgi:hypothetical protein
LDVVENKRANKKQSIYPTMFMIIRELLANLVRSIIYFQYDSLWKINKISSNWAGTHDLYDQKGVRLKGGKHGPFFSTGYGRHPNANGALEPTMCMVAKHLAENRRLPTVTYVIENRTRSSLAARNQGFGTHDVYEAEGFSSRLCFGDSPPPSLYHSLDVASL